MKLPKLQNSDKYVGCMYSISATIPASVLPLRRLPNFSKAKNTKMARSIKFTKAYPDGRLELKGIRSEIFQLEAGMFFPMKPRFDTAKGDIQRSCSIWL